mgnify:CR=1 FL=1
MRYLTLSLLCLLPLAIACTSEMSGQAAGVVSENTPVFQPKALLSLLVKDSSLYDHFEIGPSGIAMYASAEDKRNRQVEAFIYAEEYEGFANLFSQLSLDSVVAIYKQKGMGRLPARLHFPTPNAFSPPPGTEKPLTGLRVALDPGHFAGDMEIAELEGKYMKMRASPRTGGQEVAFNEANLSLATAYLIRDQLRALGATVLLSRSQPGKGVRDITYPEWREREAYQTLLAEMAAGRIDSSKRDWWQRKADEKAWCKNVFNAVDLRLRAEKINAFQPHLTLIIHYNIDSPNWELRDKEGFFTPTNTNYLMAFTPGSFMKGELEDAESRVAFLRQLLTRDVESSVRLSEAFVRQSVLHTGVPIISEPNDLPYLSRGFSRGGRPGCDRPHPPPPPPHRRAGLLRREPLSGQ